MHRIHLNMTLVFALLFMCIVFFSPIILKNQSYAQPNPPDMQNRPGHLSDDNDSLKAKDLVKYMNARSNDSVSVGRDRIIGRDEIIENNVVVIGADLTVYGQVNGDAVCIGGDMKVGPQAVIRGDLVNLGGNLDVDPSAKIYKDRVNIGGPFDLLRGMNDGDFQKLGNKLSLIGKIVRIAMDCIYLMLLLFLALLLTTFMPGQFNTLQQKLTNEFPRCVLLGIASMIGLPIIMIALVITLVGILAVPFLLLVFTLSSLAGYIVFSRILGSRLLPEEAVMLQVLAGLLLLHSPLLAGDMLLLPGLTILSVIGHVFRMVGIIILIGINFIGLGAVIYALLERRSPSDPDAGQPNDINSGLPGKIGATTV